MAITLSFNTDLYRVQISATSLTVDEVRVERSTNELFWQTVRGGVALDSSGGSIALDDFEYAEGVENFYRVVDTADDSVEESDSITPSNAGAVVFKSVRHPFLNRVLPRVLRRDPSIGRRSRSEEFPVTGRSVGVATTDVRLGQQFTLSALVETDPLEWARDMDLILASGDIFFIHVPADSVVPGGYVIIGDSRQDMLTGGTESPQEFTLPCTVVAPPSPLVVGTLLTWGTVFDLYGDWTALINANATWADLLATVGDPSDLVVL